MMMFFFEMFFLSIISFLIGMWMYIDGFFCSFDWVLVGSLYGVDLVYEIYLDFMSMFFISVILMISSLICGYSFYYVGEFLYRFYMLMSLFILSMIFLVMSPNFISMMLGWDGLGFVSFMLVLFYYSSEMSISNSLVTLLFNRLGDSFLLVSISFINMYSGFSKIGVDFYGLSLIFILISLGLCTKSAQFPFMSWLPKAMSAPTPVSSLVHSSTLVTSGVYLMIRFPNVVYFNTMLMLMSLFTMLISGLLALFEYDLKKIIAFSTLSQLGLMIFGLVWGLVDWVYFHMLCHAIYKSMIFMCCGIFIHEYWGWQDLRSLGGVMYVMPISSICFIGGLMSLSGVYFMTGFFSKDLILEGIFFNDFSLFIFFMVLISMGLSLFYSWRVILYMLGSSYFISFYSNFSDSEMSYFLFLLYFGALFIGFMMEALIYEYFCFYYLGELKLMVFFILFILFFFGMLNFNSFLYLNFDYYFILNSIFFWSNYFVLFDSYWLELMVGYKFMKLIFWIYMKIKDYSYYMVIFFSLILLLLF